MTPVPAEAVKNLKNAVGKQVNKILKKNYLPVSLQRQTGLIGLWKDLNKNKHTKEY